MKRRNAGGIAALASRGPPGSTATLTKAQMEELKKPMIKGPEPEVHKVIHWRCVDPCAEMTRRFSALMTKRPIGKWLGMT